MWVFFLLLLTPAFASAATDLTFAPSSGTVETGDVFDVSLVVNTDVPINAAEATLAFNPKSVSIEAIDTAQSVLVGWPTQPFFSNDRGEIVFSGSTDAPFIGENGRLLTIRFKALATGAHEIRIADAAVLAQDGGTNVVSGLTSGIYRAEPSTSVPSAIDTPISTPADAVPPPIPLFETKSADIALGDRLVVRGLVVPGVTVRLNVSHDETEHDVVVPSAGDGSFTYASDFRVEEGVYRVTAFSEGQNGRSDVSEQLSFTVRPVGLAAAAATTIDVLTYAIPFLLSVIVLGGLVAFVLNRRAR